MNLNRLKNSALFEYLQNNGGLTVDCQTASALTTGHYYIVSIPNHEKKAPFSDPEQVKQAIDSYVKENRDILHKYRYYLGLWIENGQLVLDISRVYPKRTFNKAKILKIAKENNQRAVYDLGLNKTIFVK